MSKVTFTTPKGKAVWPKIDTPDTKWDEDGLYSCKLHVSETDFAAFEAQILKVVDADYDAACKREGKKLRKAGSSPLRLTEDNEYEIYAKQKAKVKTRKGDILEFNIPCYDSTGKKLEEAPRIGSGSEIKIAVEVATWYVASQGFGYSLRLRAAQIIELVEFGEDASFGFSDEGSSFVGSGESFNDTFKADEEAETADAPF